MTKKRKRPTSEVTQDIPRETMAATIDRTRRKVTPDRADLPVGGRYRAAAKILPMIQISDVVGGVQLAIPFGGEPRSVALAHRIAARAIELLHAEMREGIYDFPEIVITRWSVAVRVEPHSGRDYLSESTRVAKMLDSAAKTEARAGGKPTHRVVAK